jgi:hypothetical protein
MSATVHPVPVLMAAKQGLGESGVPNWGATSLRAGSVGDLAATAATALSIVILTLQIGTAPFIAFSKFRRRVRHDQ